MNYIQIKELQKTPLSVWQCFDGEERVFWYDPTKQHYIIGAVRDASVEEHQVKEYPYVWYSETFFKNKKSPLWGDMGNELVAFQYYYVWNGTEGCLWAKESLEKEQIQRIVGDSDSDDKTVAYGNGVKGGKSAVPGNAVAYGEATQITAREAGTGHIYTMTTDDYDAWTEFFGAIKDSINSGETVKIVASRAVELQSEDTFNVESILSKLLVNNRNSFVFAYQKGEALFLGATPEILVQQCGDEVLSYALAGTIKKQSPNDRESGQILLNDEKNCFEHGIVVDMIRRTMEDMAGRSNGSSNVVHSGPMELMELKNLYHLRTILTAPAAHKGILEWARALHPTPAMGGQPREKALALLAAKEPYERGLYAAPLGMLEGNGDGTVVVGIRSALIKGKQAYAFAGCGIVADSDCHSEYEETATKLGTILEAL
ncbi:MAG: isochorismate synthase [Veillonella sp.]|uniref:isochorismate synthase n=1 Tax=Veillonella sp. TaxID=1926307 RepID=UPI00260092E0|nr:isochorismate synthase [Veillonella sp.]MBS4913453.1 isochorismate synthase [Veillonella sp.]